MKLKEARAHKNGRGKHSDCMEYCYSFRSFFFLRIRRDTALVTRIARRTSTERASPALERSGLKEEVEIINVNSMF